MGYNRYMNKTNRLAADIAAARTKLASVTALLTAETAKGADACDATLADLRDQHNSLQDRLCDLLNAQIEAVTV